MLTQEQQKRLQEIEELSARVAAGVSASETLSLANRIAAAFEEYRRDLSRSGNENRGGSSNATPQPGRQR